MVIYDIDTPEREEVTRPPAAAGSNFESHFVRANIGKDPMIADCLQMRELLRVAPMETVNSIPRGLAVPFGLTQHPNMHR
jgi:hypothetical protein